MTRRSAISLFIQNTYAMICQCDPRVAGWNDRGDMFIIRSSQILTETFIPQYFEHKNFLSFSRQLNQYGFQKSQSMHDGNSIRFSHKFFHRDHPDLLCKITKRTSSSSGSNLALNKASKEEISMLREHVATLEKKIASMTSNFEAKIRKIEEFFESSKKEYAHECTNDKRDFEPPLKKQKRKHFEEKLENSCHSNGGPIIETPKRFRGPDRSVSMSPISLDDPFTTNAVAEGEIISFVSDLFPR